MGTARHLSRSVSALVRAGGLEPPRGYPQRIFVPASAFAAPPPRGRASQGSWSGLSLHPAPAERDDLVVIPLCLLLEHDLFREPVPTPDQARGRLFRDHAPTEFRCCPSSLYTFPLPGLARDCRREVSPSLGSSASAVSRGALKAFKSVASAIPPRPRGAHSYTGAAGSRQGDPRCPVPGCEKRC
jgi:hypothetical protein